ncbi:MAG: HAD-IIB family hydrolase [Pirellulaceae bacterium]
MKKCKLLVSDVDFTLLGNAEHLSRFAKWLDEHRACIQLVLTSGRFIESIVDSVRETALPEPDYIVGGVGTEIQNYGDGTSIDAWDSDLAGNWDGDRVRQLLAEFDRLEPQADEFQSEFKVSYFLHEATPQELDSITRFLQEHSIDAELIYSSDRDLDVLPAGCNKGTAAEFLTDHLGYESDDVIVCGDSANDLAMFQFDFHGIVVGNAHPELRALDDPAVYQSPHNYAAGVLDGLEHWLHRRPGKPLTAADPATSAHPGEPCSFSRPTLLPRS